MSYIPVRFPGWRWGPGYPEGRIFDRPEDVPEGWTDNPNDFLPDPLDHDGDGRKGGSTSAMNEALDEAREALLAERERYKRRFGKKPFHGWGIPELRKRIDG